MYIDAGLLLDDAAAITVTRDSTNVVDLGVALRDIGAGEQLYVVIVVDEAFTAAGAATLTTVLSTGVATTLGTTIISTPAIGKAALTLGRVPIVIPIPPNIAERYIGLEYTVATGPMTAGTVTAFIAKDVTTFS